MQVTLDPTQAAILSTLVNQGQYPSMQIALNAALLQLLEDAQNSDVLDNPDYAAWVEQTREQINAARAQIARGEVQPLETVLSDLRAKVQRAKDAAI
ncbi:MAG: hypothetical protein AAGD25_02415 [Cyanobacteria bacterium P01_F01_bin.150]